MAAIRKKTASVIERTKWVKNALNDESRKKNRLLQELVDRQSTTVAQEIAHLRQLNNADTIKIKKLNALLHQRRAEPDWLANDATWTKDDDAWRSSVWPEDEGPESGPATNILTKAGMWHSGPINEAQWVIFDFVDKRELSKFEIFHVIRSSQCPKECELQMEIEKDSSEATEAAQADEQGVREDSAAEEAPSSGEGGVTWKTVVAFECSETSPEEEFHFAPTTAQRWRLPVG